VSHLEWVQAISGMYWEEDQVVYELERKMLKALTNVWEIHKKRDVTFRCAAYIAAIE